MAGAKSKKRDIVTIGDRLYFAYANLAMAQVAVEKNVSRYGTVHYMVRSRLYSGLCSGSMKIGAMGRMSVSK